MDFLINNQSNNYSIQEMKNYGNQNEKYWNSQKGKKKTKSRKEQKKYKKIKQMNGKETLIHNINLKEKNSNYYKIKDFNEINNQEELIKNNEEQNENKHYLTNISYNNINDYLFQNQIQNSNKKNKGNNYLLKINNFNIKNFYIENGNSEQKKLINNIKTNNSNINLYDNSNNNEINRNLNNEYNGNLYIKNIKEKENPNNNIFKNELFLNDNINQFKIKNNNINIQNNNQFVNYNLPNIENYNNKINIINFVEENINNNSLKQKEKKYIFMSNILKKAPLKLNPKSKPFIINNNINNNENIIEEKNKVILNLKIKIPNEKNDLIIPLQDNDNFFSILSTFTEKKVLDRNQCNIILKEVNKAINLIKNFSHIIIKDNSINSMNKIYDFIHH